VLQELCHLAMREKLVGDSCLDVRPIAWIIHLRQNGEFLSISGTHEAEVLPEPKKGAKPKKPKEFAKKFTIPRQFNPDTGGTRTSGDYAYFMVDKSDYVLGCALGAKAGKPPADPKLINRHRLFIDKVKACHEATQEKQVLALVSFLEKIHQEGLPFDLPEKTAPGDLYGFVVRPDIDEFVHDLPSVQQYWRDCCKRPEKDDSGRVCLITGKSVGETFLFPQIKRVPGAQASSGLVSFEMQASRSYGWDKISNATVSAEAAQAATVAMNRLLDPAYQTQDGKVLQKRHIRISEDTIVCYWAQRKEGDALSNALPHLLQADEGGKPEALWTAVWKGRPPQDIDAGSFYAVTLTGAQGRVIVRDWYETTVEFVGVSVAEYFKQLYLAPNTRPAKDKSLPPHYSLRLLQECLVPSRKAEDLPAKYAAGIFAASINQNILFPASLLALALQRMRAESDREEWIDSYRRDARTALIKAILIRNYKLNFLSNMDDDLKNQQPGYLLGRLFACIERMQYLALDQVNANIANRYFAAASSTPASVFVGLNTALVQHYYKKALRRRPKLAKEANDQIIEINQAHDKVRDPDVGYPARLRTTEQGLFMIGYHVQMGFFKRDKNTEDPENANDQANSETTDSAD
jgi:CRISPR-associated protein Csd1